MKVHYRSIVDEIDDIICKAKEQHRTVKQIELNKAEWFEFKRNIPKEVVFGQRVGILDDFLYNGVTIKLERASENTER